MRVTALPPLDSRQDVGTESVNLVFNSECPSDRQNKIIAAWDDAIRLASNIGTVDFNDFAAIEFFGPPALNREFTVSIQRFMCLSPCPNTSRRELPKEYPSCLGCCENF